MIKVTLKEQECKGTYKFDGQILYTKGMEEVFGDNVAEVIFKTMLLIYKLIKQNIADYFQVAYAEKDGEKIKFYVIDDIDHITFLLPSEY